MLLFLIIPFEGGEKKERARFCGVMNHTPEFLERQTNIMGRVIYLVSVALSCISCRNFSCPCLVSAVDCNFRISTNTVVTKVHIFRLTVSLALISHCGCEFLALLVVDGANDSLVTPMNTENPTINYLNLCFKAVNKCKYPTFTCLPALFWTPVILEGNIWVFND